MFVVRDGNPADVEAASALIRAAYAEYKPFYPQDRWSDYIANVGKLGERPDGYQLVLAVDAERLVGAVLFYPDASRAGQGDWPPGSAALLRLAVLPVARGHGVGRALVEECIRRARALGVNSLALHTTVWMAVARAMYERMGFVRVPEYDFRPRPGVVGMGYVFDLTAPVLRS